MKTPQTMIDKALALCIKADSQGFAKVESGIFLFTREFSGIPDLPPSVKYVIINCLMSHSDCIGWLGWKNGKIQAITLI